MNMTSAGPIRPNTYHNDDNEDDDDDDTWDSGEELDDPADQDFMGDDAPFASPMLTKRKRKAIAVSMRMRKDHKAPAKVLTELSSIYPHRSDSVPAFDGIQEICGRAILKIQTYGSQHTYRLTFLSNTVAPRRGLQKKSSRKISQYFDDETLNSPVTSEASSNVVSKRQRYSSDENALLKKLKDGEYRSWKDIARHFPGRKIQALQSHYFAKLKD